MTEQIKKKLSDMTAERLAAIVLAALDEMNDAKQIDFIARHIDARSSLLRLGEDDPKAFIDEVDVFCQDCLNAAFYSDESDIEDFFMENSYDQYGYDDEWDYDEYYKNTEWAETFSRLFKLSMMYLRSENIETGYEANTRLLACLGKMNADSSFLGTNEPMMYIDTDWNELFELHYRALFQYQEDAGRAIGMAFHYWSDFGGHCTEGFLSTVKDRALAERIILDGLKNSTDWAFQRRCFILLEQLCIRLGERFDKSAQAEALISANVYFYQDVTEGLYEGENWQAAIETALIALQKIPPVAADSTDWHNNRARQNVRDSIQANLLGAYEKLENYTQAFEAAKRMFQETPNFALYKRARGLAEKGASVSAFLALAEENDRQGGLIGKIYSYEGEMNKLLDRAMSKPIENNYYDRKYIALSFIYRAVGDAKNIGDGLSEYLSTAARQEGIEDMINLTENDDQENVLLMNGAVLL